MGKHFLDIIKALGKTSAKKAKVTISLNTNGGTIVCTTPDHQITVTVDEPHTHAASAVFELSDIGGILDLDKKRFDLDLDESSLNDLPLFTTEAAIITVGQPDRTIEFEDMSVFADKGVLPTIAKDLKKSLIRESEFLLWRVQPGLVELCQVFPTKWGVPFSLEGDFGNDLNFFTGKGDIKLLIGLIDGRFKVSNTNEGIVVTDDTYSIFIRQGELSQDLYPPFA